MKVETKVLWLLAASFIVGLLFDLIPFVPAQPQKLFLLVDGREFGMTLEWYMYLCGEKISRMIIFYAFYMVTKFKIVHLFFVLECLDLVDFMVIMNRPWFHFLAFGVEVPFEFNTAKLCVIITAVVYLWINKR